MIKKRNQVPGVADVDLPWVKLGMVGPEGLRDEELLAVVLKNGYDNQKALELSSTVLRKHPAHELVNMSTEEMQKIKGLGKRRVDLLIAAFELAKRALNQGMGIMPSISRPVDVLPIIADIKDAKKEHFVAVFLNARNQVIARETVSVGSLNASLVHPREVFASAIGSTAASVILCHNHPSGAVEPSREDIELTRRMGQAGEILGIEILDHIIVGPERFLSMKEGNLM